MSESFRSRLFQDIQKSLKYTIATKIVRLTLFILFEVFVDFFFDEQIRTTKTMFICKSESCLDFLNDKWDSKESWGTLCLLQKKSIICKYIIGSQNFVVSFYYNRFHLLNGQLIPLDRDTASNPKNKPLALEIYFEEGLLIVIDTMSSTSLAQLKTKLTFEDLPLMPKNYAFSLNKRKVLTKLRNFICIINMVHNIEINVLFFFRFHDARRIQHYARKLVQKHYTWLLHRELATSNHIVINELYFKKW